MLLPAVTGRYALSETSLPELRHHRYLDICLGLLLLASMLCLLQGAQAGAGAAVPLLAFFILSSLVCTAYWAWYLYTKYAAAAPVFGARVCNDLY